MKRMAWRTLAAALVLGGLVSTTWAACTCLISITSPAQVEADDQTHVASVTASWSATVNEDQAGDCGNCAVVINWVIRKLDGTPVSYGNTQPLQVVPPGAAGTHTVQNVPVDHVVTFTATLVCVKITQVGGQTVAETVCQDTDTTSTIVVPKPH